MFDPEMFCASLVSAEVQAARQTEYEPCSVIRSAVHDDFTRLGFTFSTMIGLKSGIKSTCISLSICLEYTANLLHSFTGSLYSRGSDSNRVFVLPVLQGLNSLEF